MPFVLLSLACAPESTPSFDETVAPLEEAGPSRFTAELEGYEPALDGPLMAELIEQVPGTPTTYNPPTARQAIAASGAIEFELPSAPEGVDSMRYRVAIRVEKRDHTSGAIRAMFAPVLVWSSEETEAGAPEGWSFETGRGDGVEYEALGRPGIALALTPEPELTLTGPFTATGIDPLDTVGIALLADGEPVPGIVGLAIGATWALVLDGEPAGFVGGHLRPVAYLESDGELGFDPEAEERVGEACAMGVPAFVRWMAEPMEPLQADVLTFAHATPGWNAWRGETRRGRAITGRAPIQIAEACE